MSLSLLNVLLTGCEAFHSSLINVHFNRQHTWSGTRLICPAFSVNTSSDWSSFSSHCACASMTSRFLPWKAASQSTNQPISWFREKWRIHEFNKKGGPIFQRINRRDAAVIANYTSWKYNTVIQICNYRMCKKTRMALLNDLMNGSEGHDNDERNWNAQKIGHTREAQNWTNQPCVQSFERCTDLPNFLR